MLGYESKIVRRYTFAIKEILSHRIPLGFELSKDLAFRVISQVADGDEATNV